MYSHGIAKFAGYAAGDRRNACRSFCGLALSLYNIFLIYHVSVYPTAASSSATCFVGYNWGVIPSAPLDM